MGKGISCKVNFAMGERGCFAGSHSPRVTAVAIFPSEGTTTEHGGKRGILNETGISRYFFLPCQKTMNYERTGERKSDATGDVEAICRGVRDA